MAQQLKRWESPRRKGRNDKGRGGSARQRQRRKQIQALRKKLSADHPDSSNPSIENRKGKLPNAASLFTEVLTKLRQKMSAAERAPVECCAARSLKLVQSPIFIAPVRDS